MTDSETVDFQDTPKTMMGEDTAYNVESPIILGIAVVGLLVGCAMYHMCYKTIRNRSNSTIFHFRNRGPSRAEIRATTSIFQHLYQMSPNNEPGNKL